MKIHYIEDTAGNKMFSFFRHDFRKSEDGSFIDGGFDYIRTNREVHHAEISDVIEDIRKNFYWTSVYDVNGKPIQPKQKCLKDLDTDHIINIMAHFANLFDNQLFKFTQQWKITHNIFLAELQYRIKHEIFWPERA